MSRKHEQHQIPAADPDAQQAGTGKVANDHNKMGHQAPTQTNQGRRTPESRNDRETQTGGYNQSQVRRGVPGGGQR